jgi:hypothetical protein
LCKVQELSIESANFSGYLHSCCLLPFCTRLLEQVEKRRSWEVNWSVLSFRTMSDDFRDDLADSEARVQGHIINRSVVGSSVSSCRRNWKTSFIWDSSKDFYCNLSHRSLFLYLGTLLTLKLRHLGPTPSSPLDKQNKETEESARVSTVGQGQRGPVLEY